MEKDKLVDDYLHLGARRRLVQSLRDRGIRDETVLEAIAQVPRHWFVGKAYESLAYEDRALPILNEQTISQPYTVARQTELLQLREREKVLEVGTGSGYQAAILAQLGHRVFTLERQERLYAHARALFRRIRRTRIRPFLQDGYLGLPVYGPYDGIVVTCGAREIPGTLVEQLAPGGRLVIPVGDDRQRMLRITKLPDGSTRTETFGDFRFVPFSAGRALIE